MNTRGIDAYDLPERIVSYDADMEVMHPNRSKMVQVALDILPFPPDTPLKAADLGVGTGYFTERFLRHFPGATVVAVDGAPAMMDLVDARLADLHRRATFIVGDFRNVAQLASDPTSFDVVFSSYALHHLDRREKTSVVRQSLELLRPGGWFLNADLIVADSPEMESRIQQRRVQGILGRAAPDDDRFSTTSGIRAFLDAIEERDGDQPLTLAEDLDILKEAGLKSPTVFWLEHREAVCGGIA